MKNQEDILNESILTEATYLTQNKSIQNNALCSSNNPALLLCMNRKCQKPAFICSIEECTCKSQHEICYRLDIKSLLQNIKSQQCLVESIQTFINDKIQKMINFMSEYKEKTIKNLKQQFEMFGLRQREKDLINEIRQGKCEKITGKIVWEMIHSQKVKQKVKKMVEESHKNLQSNFQKAKQTFEQNFKNNSSEIQKLKQSTEQYLNLIDTFYQSKILCTTSDIEIVKDFFKQKIIKSAKLLYRASQNNFQVSKFHQKCDNIPYTLTLVETEFGKKIGGYTPIQWKSPNNYGYVKDESMTSFLFSLTQGDKFQLTNKDIAVNHHSNYGPVFGSGTDLYIGNESNISNNSYADINRTYKNSKYEYNNNNTWLRFNGDSSSCNFRTKQWQVWGIELI